MILAAIMLSALVYADDAIRFAEPEIRLWPNMNDPRPESWNPRADGFHRVTNIHNPSITVFLPAKAKPMEPRSLSALGEVISIW